MQNSAFCKQVRASPLFSNLIRPGSLNAQGVESATGFNSKGPGGIAENAIAAFSVGGMAALQANEMGNQALADAASEYPGMSATGTVRDAFKHFDWSLRMGQGQGLRQWGNPQVIARTLGDAHEAQRTNNPPGDRAQDLLNNHNARIIAQIFPNADPVQTTRLAIENGLTQNTFVGEASK